MFSSAESAHKFKTTFFCTYYQIRKSARAGVFVVFIAIVVVLYHQRVRVGDFCCWSFSSSVFCFCARKVVCRVSFCEIGEKRERKEKKHTNCNQFSRSDAREKTLQKRDETHSREAYNTTQQQSVPKRVVAVISIIVKRRPTTTVRESE